MTTPEIIKALESALAYAREGQLFIARRFVEAAALGLERATEARPKAPTRLRVVKEGE